MDLYIANASMQTFDFMYRVPGTNGVRKQTIPIGEQIKISGSLSQPEVDAIIDQHRPYGMVESSELDRVRGRFGALVYSVDKPVAASRLAQAQDVRIDDLVKQGAESRKAAAIQANKLIEDELPRGSTLNKMIMTMQEEDRTLQSDETPSPKISEGLIITRDKNHPAMEQIGSAKRARRRGKDN